MDGYFGSGIPKIIKFRKQQFRTLFYSKSICKTKRIEIFPRQMIYIFLSGIILLLFSGNICVPQAHLVLQSKWSDAPHSAFFRFQ